MLQYLQLWFKNNFALFALLILAIFIYTPSLNGEFVIDDVIFIKDNPYITNISDVKRFFTHGLWENSSLEVNTEAMYRPMNLVPMLLNHSLWGNNPFGYHIFLLLLHLVNTLLVYVLIRKLAGSTKLAATFGAAVFSLHPARVESVAWISGGIDPLVSFFLFTALLSHIIPTINSAIGKSWRYQVLTLLFFQLALWSKEVAIFFPIIIVAYDWIFKRKINWPLVLMHAVIIIVYLFLRSIVLGSTGKWSDLDLAQFSKVIDFGLGYIELLVYPAHIPLYIQPPASGVSSILGIVSVLIISLLLVYCWKVFDVAKRKLILFTAVWTLGFFWPAVLLSLYTNGFYAGRFWYVPSLGVGIFLAVCFDYLIVTYAHLKSLLISMSIFLICFYCFITWKVIPVWHDGASIYGKIAEDSPENSVGFVGMAEFYMDKSEYAEAEKYFLLALERIKIPQSRVPLLVNLGMINGRNNYFDVSKRYFTEAVTIDPTSTQGWAGLGNLALMTGEYFESIASYEKAIAADPKNYEATMNLAVAYDKTGQFQRGELLRKKAYLISH